MKSSDTKYALLIPNQTLLMLDNEVVMNCNQHEKNFANMIKRLEKKEKYSIFITYVLLVK